MIGKSPWLQSVFVETDAAIGDMLDVTWSPTPCPTAWRRLRASEGRLMAKRDLAPVRQRSTKAAPGSSWSSSSPICSGPCSAITTATW
jgi:hypothetical protein